MLHRSKISYGVYLYHHTSHRNRGLYRGLEALRQPENFDPQCLPSYDRSNPPCRLAVPGISVDDARINRLKKHFPYPALIPFEGAKGPMAPYRRGLEVSRRTRGVYDEPTTLG